MSFMGIRWTNCAEFYGCALHRGAAAPGVDPLVRRVRGLSAALARARRHRRGTAGREPRIECFRLAPPMPASALSALSPLDGRYAAKVAALRPLLSEFGLMHRRVQVEVEWLIALSDAGLDALPPLSAGTRAALRERVDAFSEADAEAIKAIERTTNHDVKAVEYWLRECLAAYPELAGTESFIHFACTSEDINNTSHALLLKAARADVLLPALDGLLKRLTAMAHGHADVAMLSRTHGQTASPTTVGKEIANVVARLGAARSKVAQVELLAKLNGAVGNYNAHVAAVPAIDWPALAR